MSAYSGPIPALDPPWSLSAAPVRRVFYISLQQWGAVLGIAALSAVSTISLYEGDSLWIGVGIFLFVAVLGHTLLAAHSVPWIPGLIALVAVLQWVLAPWAAYHVPASFPLFEMVLPAPDYFNYAVPAALMLLLGLYTPLWRVGDRAVVRRAPTVPRGFRRACDLMIVFGFAANVAMGHAPGSLRYLALLLSYLAFVGAFALLLVRADGWWWRVAFVLGLRAVESTEGGLFHDLLLWGAYCGALMVYSFRPSRTVVIAAGLGGVLMIGALNEAKYTYRRELFLNPDMQLSERVATLGRDLRDQVTEPRTTFTGDAMSRSVTRLNQGWIIARILTWVPTSEPFAGGETIVTALRAALVPRILDADKYVAGGAQDFPRFTGLTIDQSTSMNLSPAGEMYANFGRTGGLVALYLFGVGLGLVYLRFATWARRSPLWWAWAPYVMLYAMQAENGLGEGINHVAKSFVLLFVVISVVPAWRSLRRWRLPAAALRLGA